jgi:hypothetical protein
MELDLGPNTNIRQAKYIMKMFPSVALNFESLDAGALAIFQLFLRACNQQLI